MIDANTPVEEVGNSRAKIVCLAQKVFDKTETQAVRAFSQFRTKSDIAEVIEAKRNNIFDFGICIRKTAPNSFMWPAADVVLNCIQKAKNGEIDEIDLENLGLEETDLEKLLMNESATKKKAPVKRRGRKKNSKADPIESPVEEVRAAEQPEEDVSVEENNGNLEASLENAFTTLDSRIEKNSDAMHAKFDAMHTKVDALFLALKGMIGIVETTHRNTLALAARQKDFADGVSYVLLQSEAETETDIHQIPDEALNDVREAYGQTPLEVPADSETNIQAQEPESPIEEEVVEDAPADNGGGNVVFYTKEQLTKMDRDEIVAIAERIGVANSNKVPYTGVLIRKIINLQVPE
jgi:hypothetical protein